MQDARHSEGVVALSIHPVGLRGSLANCRTLLYAADKVAVTSSNSCMEVGSTERCCDVQVGETVADDEVMAHESSTPMAVRCETYQKPPFLSGFQ